VKKSPPESLLLFLLQLVWGLVSDSIDTILVWLHLKHWPSTGRAQWNRQPRSDPRSQAWQRLIAPPTAKHPPPATCPHRDTFGRSWVVPSHAASQGHTGPARVCVQCGATISEDP
jgi:hypothetical protein